MVLSTANAIGKVEAFPVRLARDLKQSTGLAGSPTQLGTSAGAYRWSATVPALYSEFIESTLVRVMLSNGLYGWGEAQAPLAPRVSAAIITGLLGPAIEGQAFDGSRAGIERLWSQMFQTMRVRGQTGGFMMDAISGVDIALWDLAGKLSGLPVAQMLAGERTRQTVPAYLSGVRGPNTQARAEYAASLQSEGFQTFKIFFDSDGEAILELLDAMRGRLGPSARIALDALWRLDPYEDDALLRELSARDLYWLEAPFMPDLVEPHVRLAERHDFPLALGESYRTAREMAWFLNPRLVRFVQPDLGRSGITETLRIAATAEANDIAVVPHVSIALGPQIAAAVHCSGAIRNCELCEFNPTVFETGNRYLDEPLAFDKGAYQVPGGAGLGVDIRLEELERDCLELP